MDVRKEILTGMLRTTGSKRVSVIIQDKKGRYLIAERAGVAEEPVEFPSFSCKDAKLPEGDEGITLVTEGIKEVIGIEIKDPKLIETFFDDEYPFYHYIFRVEKYSGSPVKGYYDGIYWQKLDEINREGMSWIALQVYQKVSECAYCLKICNKKPEIDIFIQEYMSHDAGRMVSEILDSPAADNEDAYNMALRYYFSHLRAWLVESPNLNLLNLVRLIVVEQNENTPKAEVEGFDEELAANIMTDDEKNKVQSGQKATLILKLTNLDSSVPQEEKALTKNILTSSTSKGKVGMYFDLSLWLKIGANYERQISETGGKQITVKFEVPENLYAPTGVSRKFYLFHIHKGAAKKIAETKNLTIPVTVGEFSTFVLAYEDDSAIDEALGFYSGLKITQKNGKIKVSWDKGEGAAKYALFATYCGTNYSNKPIKTTKSTSVTIKKIKDKKIDFTKNFKLYVKAYDSNGNVVGNSVHAHFAGKDHEKYKNPKDIKLGAKNGFAKKVAVTVN